MCLSTLANFIYGCNYIFGIRMIFRFFTLVVSLKTDSDTLSSLMKKIRFRDLYRMLFSLIYKLANFPDRIDEKYKNVR